MGVGSKIAHVALRVWQLVCSVIVLGILARELRQVSAAGASRDGRIIYGIVVASISTVFTLIFILPFLYAFMAFPFDLIMFIMWLVLFCLLITRTGTRTCSGPWFWNYWGFYWGGWWRRPVPAVISSGCGHWRTVLAFSFMALFAFLVSAILGGYLVSKHRRKGRDRRTGAAASTGANPPTTQIGGPAHQTGVAGSGAAPETAQPGTYHNV